jgi:3-hydroxyisobutyrate dehydrogenase
VIAMLADDRASRSVWLGLDGALAGAKPGAILIECSTLSLEWLRALAAEAEASGAVLLDAPVAGSKGAAAGGQLTFMVGGPEEALQSVRAVLAAMGQKVVHLGPSGSGMTLKLINNYMGAVQVASLAEGLVMAERAGLDMSQVVETLSNGSPGSPVVRAKAPAMARHEYGETQFALRLMRKDLGYALDLAEALGVPAPTGAIARQIYRTAGSLGFDEADWAAVIEAISLKGE